ncbi:hypothetical protein [Oceanithermus desulfurans]|uniref:Serine protease n=2 Tax=Oceanithermus desulfurans TaxID=227924 RepID=A0A511RJN2_9DEIN|nr:hypothetical protein [Oceanithermus desulfurans]MBB6029903.1 hypothetical protein [Oceanithermus desulfurans]GEM89865.1 hypothetical protein ODE01S_12990 [Oceanithermus desulfurans NBRC 100063]
MPKPHRTPEHTGNAGEKGGGATRWPLLMLLVAFALLAGCNPTPQKTLANKLRPFQAGSWIDVEQPSLSKIAHCSYGFHAQRYGQIGLVTAVHCTDTVFGQDGRFTVSDERVWQSYDDDTNAVARVALKPTLVNYSNDDTCRAAIDALGSQGYGIYWCLGADAAFAPFINQGIRDDEDMYKLGAVANLPLSDTKTRLGPVKEKDPARYTGYLYAPLADDPIYKIGSTTGKTESTLYANAMKGNFIAPFPDGHDILYLGVYFATGTHAAPLVDKGDSGGGGVSVLLGSGRRL